MQIENTALTSPPQPLPACGFKEWSMVCDALGAGAQSIILRGLQQIMHRLRCRLGDVFPDDRGQ